MTDDPSDSSKIAGMAFGEALRRFANTKPEEVTQAANADMRDRAIEGLITAFEDAAQVDEDGTEFWNARTCKRSSNRPDGTISPTLSSAPK